MPSVRRLYRFQRKHKQSRTPGKSLANQQLPSHLSLLLLNFFFFLFKMSALKLLGFPWKDIQTTSSHLGLLAASRSCYAEPTGSHKQRFAEGVLSVLL